MKNWQLVISAIGITVFVVFGTIFLLKRHDVLTIVIQDCAESEHSIEQQIALYNASQHLESKPAGATYAAGSYINRETLYKVFYSPALNTCVGVVENQTLVQTDGTLAVYEDSYNFEEVSTGKLRDWVYVTKHGSPYEDIVNVTAKIAEYSTALDSAK